jgi:hypothetical protein
MTEMRRRIVILACGAGLGVAVPGLALANHVQQLSAVLTPVFLAENFAIVCAARDPTFLDEARGPLGPVAAYSRHMKSEVVAGLSTDELLAVLKAAADDARSLALATLRSLEGSADQQLALDRWCATAARDQVLRVLRLHDAEHDAFIRSVMTAMSNRGASHR